MGISKTEQYTKEQTEFAGILKALGHPARWAIIELLLAKKECVCSDIMEEIHLSQPTVSQHLKALKDVGLIQGTIEGKSICYCINPKVFKIVLEKMHGIETSLSDASNISCC